MFHIEVDVTPRPGETAAQVRDRVDGWVRFGTIRDAISAAAIDFSALRLMESPPPPALAERYAIYHPRKARHGDDLAPNSVVELTAADQHHLCLRSRRQFPILTVRMLNRIAIHHSRMTTPSTGRACSGLSSVSASGCQ